MHLKKYHSIVAAVLIFVLLSPVAGQRVKVLKRKHDPYGFPRPGRGHTHVPLKTSFYIEFGVVGVGAADDSVDPDSVRVWLKPQGGEQKILLDQKGKFGPGCFGRLFPRKNMHGKLSLAVFIDTHSSLRPKTQHTVSVFARSKKGAPLGWLDRMWSFTTEAAPTRHALAFELDLKTPPVAWDGGFFTGFCKSSFCTSHGNRIPTYELMDRVRKRSPRAWSLQRDFWMTGMQHRPQFLHPNLPNIVRERETRRIVTIDKHPDRVALRVEDFFGHAQYGIAPGRPLSADYHSGDEVLIADGLNDARTTVLGVEDKTGIVFVKPFATPEGGWRLAYEGPLPTREDPNAPGLFPPGGCYLRKFKPSGTPC